MTLDFIIENDTNLHEYIMQICSFGQDEEKVIRGLVIIAEEAQLDVTEKVYSDTAKKYITLWREKYEY